MTDTTPLTEQNLILSRQNLGGLFPFSLVEIPSFQSGVLLKDGNPVQVYSSGRRLIFRSAIFSRYELWYVNTRLSHIHVGEGKFAWTVDGWQLSGLLTVQLRVVDPRKLIAYINPVGLLGDRLYSILQTCIFRYSLGQLGPVMPEIEAEVLHQGNMFAATMGFALDLVSFTYQPGKQDPRQAQVEAFINQAGAPRIVAPGSLPVVPPVPPPQLPQASSSPVVYCPSCGQNNRQSARFCQKCGSKLT